MDARIFGAGGVEGGVVRVVDEEGWALVVISVEGRVLVGVESREGVVEGRVMDMVLEEAVVRVVQGREGVVKGRCNVGLGDREGVERRHGVREEGRE